MKKKKFSTTSKIEKSTQSVSFSFFKVLLFLLVFSTFPAIGFAQISIVKTNAILKDVLSEIESKSNYVFLYHNVDIDENKIVSIDIENQNVKSVLDHLFNDTNISYTISDHQIILTIRKSSSEKINTKREIKGVVKDEQGQPLVGVSVSIKNTAIGQMTDIDGNFTLNASEGDVIIFSFIGFISKQIVVKDGISETIILKEDNFTLEEVVVTALGIKREKKALTYNVQEIKASELTGVKDVSFVNSLAGKVAGVTINQSSSGIGGSTRVVMRGAKSLFGENNALYVLDGVPLHALKSTQSQNFYEASDQGDNEGIANFNAEDIESISVLTGASAAALYGSRGANGVILITTKSGEPGKLKASYSNNTSFHSPFVMPEFQNTYGRERGAFSSWGNKLETPSSYNPEDFFQTGYTTMHTVSLSGGDDKSRTYVSGAISDARGLIKNNDYERYNFSLRHKRSLISKILDVDFSLYYINQKDQNTTSHGLYFNPLVPIYLFPPSDDINAFKNYEQFSSEANMPVQYWPYDNEYLEGLKQNPYWILNRNMFNNKRDRYLISLAFNFTPTDWLTLSTRLRMDKAYARFERKLYASTSNQFFESKLGHYKRQNQTNKNLYADFLATLDKTFNEDYRLIVNVGSSITDERADSDGYGGNLSLIANHFHFSNINNTLDNFISIEEAVHTRTNSMYAKAELGFKNYIYLDGSGRIDYFSTLAGTGSQSVFYPSVGLTSVLSEALPLPKNVISYLKIRGSYAQVGNPPPAYLTKEYVPIVNGSITNTGFYPATNLKAEKTKSFEVGTDMALFRNKLNISFTYYNSNTYEQLFKYDLPPSSGFSFAYANAGKVNNWGLELSAGYKQKLGPVDWMTNLTYTFNRNKIKKLLPAQVIDPVSGEMVNAPTEFEVSSAGGYKMILKEGGTMSDIYTTHLVRDSKGYVRVNPFTSEIEVDNTFIKVGEATPKYQLGYRNEFSYKGITLSFLVDARVGGVVVSATQALMDQYGVSKASADARDRGGAYVNDGLLPAEYYYGVIAAGNTGSALSEYVYSATNVRVRELSVNYKIPPKLFAYKLNVSLSLTANNLLMLYNKAPFDPALTANTDTYFQGYDYFMSPSQKSLGFGVKVSY